MTEDHPLKDLTRLADICDDYLGMSFPVARRRHAEGKLSIKAFRLSGRRRGPLFVHNDDLAALIKKRRTRAPAAAAKGASVHPDQLPLELPEGGKHDRPAAEEGHHQLPQEAAV